MILLRGSKPGPLDAYEETIRSLADVFGEGSWGIISRADDVMRSEGWERKRRSIEDQVRRGAYHDVFDPTMPWAAVIRDAAADHRYWQENVKDLCGLATRRGAALDQATRAELATAAAGAGPGAGVHTGEADGHSGGGRPNRPEKAKKGAGQKGAGRGLNGKERRGDKRFVKNTKGVELCFIWNRAKDGCEAKCPRDRAHQCEWCLGPHRAVDPACEKKPSGWTPAKK